MKASASKALPLTADDISFVVDLCVRAGDIAQTMRNGVTIETKTSADDLVTSADKALSAMIVKALSERFPDDIVLSEEAPWDGRETDKRRWLIDPIDGTKYYVDNTGQWCVMVGLVEDGRESFGCFYMPTCGIALAGGPAYGKVLKYDKKRYCGARVSSEDPNAMRDLMRSWGMKVDERGLLLTRIRAVGKLFPARKKKRPVRVLVSNNDLKAHPWVASLPNVEIIRGTSLGIDVFELLEGKADVFVHIRPTLKYWDTAAPGAVAQALAMEVGSNVGDHLVYSFASPSHEPHVVIGKRGALDWWRRQLEYVHGEIARQAPGQDGGKGAS